MSDFSATVSTLTDHPEILEVIVRGGGKPEKWGRYSEAEKKTYCFFDSVLGLLERAWFGVSQKDWSDWKKWIKDLATNDTFLDVYNNKRTYNVLFTNEVDGIVKEAAEKGKALTTFKLIYSSLR